MGLALLRHGTARGSLTLLEASAKLGRVQGGYRVISPPLLAFAPS
jgi:hypothetical protein